MFNVAQNMTNEVLLHRTSGFIADNAVCSIFNSASADADPKTNQSVRLARLGCNEFPSLSLFIYLRPALFSYF